MTHRNRLAAASHLLLVGLCLLLATTVPASATLLNGIVAYWKFEDNLDDETTTGADGTFVGSSIDYDNSRTGFGRCIELDGVDEYVVIDSVPASTFDFGTGSGGTGSVSISAWFRVSAFDIGWQALVAKGEGDNWRIARRGSNDEIAYAGSAGDIYDASLNLNDGNWHHVVAITEAGVNTRIYIDGVLEDSSGGVGTLGNQNGNHMMIGNNPDSPTRFWDGWVDDVAIWDRALTTTEIASIWNGGTGTIIEDLLLVDTDSDGLSDDEENSLGTDGFITDPNNPDTDGDGVNDFLDTNPILGTNDNDGDGISNADETNGTQNPWTGSTLGTAPGDPTDPLSNDSDGDTILDGEEIVAGTDTYITNPNDADTDGDALNDGDELTNGSDPTDPFDPGNLFPVNLIGYWPFDGDLLDDSTTGAHGSFQTTSGTETYATGKFGQGIELTEANGDYVEISSAATFEAVGSDLTISAWFKVAAFTTNWQALIAKGEGTAWRIARSGGGNQLAYAGGTGDLTGGPAVDDNNFHHVVAITENGVSTRLWIDGALVGTGGSPSIGTNGSTALYIGENPQSGGRSWNGIIDDVAIWTRVLSPGEIASIWNGGTGEKIEDLLNTDSDADGMDDDWEITHFGDLSRDGTASADADSLTDLEEFQNGTDPNNPDSDSDGSNDDVEVSNGTDPNDPDSDDDGVNDGAEATAGTNPLNPDSDTDGLTDGEEINTYGTNPLLADSDSDGKDDGIEILLGFDPNVGTSTPPASAQLNGVASAGTMEPFLNTLPTNTPGAVAGNNWQTEDYFTAQGGFADLKGVTAEPNSSYIAVVERRGTIQRVDAGNRATPSRQQTLDIQSRIVYGDNGGLRSVVFHPNYNLSGQVGEHYMYCFYSTEARSDIPGFTAPYLTYSGTSDDHFFYRLSRFTRNPATGNFDPASEQVMIQQMTRDRGQHFGGGLAFGPDGFLYVAWGDTEFNNGRVGVEFYQDAQRIDRIFQCAVLRLDVDQIGGATSHAPTRTLQGNTGPQAMPGTTQSCVASDPTYGAHNYYHHDNYSGVGYYIPSDNYWVLNPPPAGSAETSPAYPAHGDALEEHHAIGFRNPWRLAADPVTGDIAVFIVGSNADPKSEEVDVIPQAGGGNYGWAYREGDHTKTSETGKGIPTGGNSYAPTYLGTETDPVAFWEHTSGNGNVATGGLYYRGTQWSSVAGKLIAADHGTGKIWSIDYLGAGAASSTLATTGGVQHPNNYTVTQLIDTNLSIRQMSASPDGQEILIAANGDIHRLYDNSSPTPNPPALLSATGAFTNLPLTIPTSSNPLNARAGMIGYEPEAPLWSDRAKKPRWMAVPNNADTPGQFDAGEQITFSENGDWAFPQGTVFVKQFTLPLDERDPDNPTLQKRLETRFAVHGDDGVYYFFTYKWNSDDTDADLIPDGSTAAYTETYNVIDENGDPYVQTWEFPSRAQCVDCHQLGANSILGVKTRQLNNMFTYPSTGTNGHQLATLNNLGLFDSPSTISQMATYLSSKNINDTTATLEERVHSYLDSNCSQCHRPGSNAGLATFDARLTTPMALTGLIDADPNAGDLGLSGAKLVKARDTANSILWVRDDAIDDPVGPPVINYQMPPLAKLQVDEDYMAVLTAWINRIGLTEFDAWAHNLGLQGSPGDDEDNDGLSSGLEFLLDFDGSVHTTLPPLSVGNGANKTVSLPLNGDALTDGFFPIVEDSLDLVTWVTAGTGGSILTLQSDTSAPGMDGIMTWQFTTSDEGYARLKLGVPAP